MWQVIISLVLLLLSIESASALRKVTASRLSKTALYSNQKAWSRIEQNGNLEKLVNEVDDHVKKTWQSGSNLVEKKKRSRFGAIPWWMSEEEKNNPRVLPAYKPHWLEKNTKVDNSWKVADLRVEATRRGLSSEGLKNELIDRINSFAASYSLDSDNFTAPKIRELSSDEDLLYACYPQVYEKELQDVKKK